jgi:hypothetical protein
MNQPSTARPEGQPAAASLNTSRPRPAQSTSHSQPTPGTSRRRPGLDTSHPRPTPSVRAMTGGSADLP